MILSNYVFEYFRNKEYDFGTFHLDKYFDGLKPIYPILDDGDVVVTIFQEKVTSVCKHLNNID